MNHSLPRFSIRLLVPAVALCAIFAMGEPLPSQAATSDDAALAAGAERTGDLVVIALRDEVKAISAEAAAAKAAARQTASRMRWAMTLPAASGGKRCFVDTCGG